MGESIWCASFPPGMHLASSTQLGREGKPWWIWALNPEEALLYDPIDNALVGYQSCLLQTWNQSPQYKRARKYKSSILLHSTELLLLTAERWWQRLILLPQRVQEAA